ncbi:hypothetical protein SEND513_5 [Mycobacterium phage Send513]|uniref:Uncharacterized protein n=3 Tax=Papyrusvirus send513 TaxID=1982556 RepID=G1BRI3_9CAUD|nr:hypothetical protein FDI62_gp05 [Mycobacterium phage Send513]AEK07451.1 hypothetical protein SEND513_5 [Mycobacterium phage Send513]ARW57091.1 hypothetical protein SEA_ZENON_6 [Mycobacterium phage Zenon]QCG78112.1 hypothetical protein SEA_CANDLE_5 [Mycobacterium phage Candle]
MPKRRVTTAKQRAASKRNLEKARKAKRKGMPEGKMVTRYRHLPEAYGKEVDKTGVFRPNGHNKIHLTNKSKGSLARLLVVGNSATFAVRVNRHKLRKDPTPLSDKSEKWSWVRPKDLAGVKIRRAR